MRGSKQSVADPEIVGGDVVEWPEARSQSAEGREMGKVWLWGGVSPSPQPHPTHLVNGGSKSLVGMWSSGRRPGAEQRKAARWVWCGCGRGIPLPTGRGLSSGLCPLSRKCFGPQNGQFRCISGANFYSSADVIWLKSDAGGDAFPLDPPLQTVKRVTWPRYVMAASAFEHCPR